MRSLLSNNFFYINRRRLAWWPTHDPNGVQNNAIRDLNTNKSRLNFLGGT